MDKEPKEEVESKQIESSKKEEKPAKPAKKRHFLRGMFILVVLMFGVFSLFYYFAPRLDVFLNPTKMIKENIPSKKTKTSPILVPQQQKEIEIKPVETESENDTTEEVVALEEKEDHLDVPLFYPEADVVNNEPEEITEQQPDSPLQDDTQNSQETEIQATPEKELRKSPQYGYSILKVIQLRDALKQGGDCRPLLEELVALPDKTPQMDQALMDLLQACLNRPLSGQMQEAFNTAKKRAILRIFQNGNSVYLAYLKALPYFVADVHIKNPTGDSPLDILNRVQQAVKDDRPHLVLQLLPELPDNVQATLYDVKQYAEQEVQLYQSFNRLMQSLFLQGGNNE